MSLAAREGSIPSVRTNSLLSRNPRDAMCPVPYSLEVQQLNLKRKIDESVIPMCYSNNSLRSDAIVMNWHPPRVLMPV